MDASPSSITFFVLCLLCTTIFNSVTCSLKIRCNQKDMNTLLRFKTGVIDPSGVLSSWFPKLDCCQWTGVKCDNITARVTELNLPCHTNQPKVVAYGEKDDKSHCLTGSNNLFGEVPFSLKSCKNLWILDLSHNNLFGVIPSWLGQSVKALLLRSNQFSGNIPTQLCRLRSLIVMDFASNRLSGPIPNCLHNITTMLSSYASSRKLGFTIHLSGLSLSTFGSIRMLIKGNDLSFVDLMNAIDLSSNNLYGNVPLEIYMLTGLQSLNLSHNQLMGTIPQEIGNLKQLESIDLSRNHFSGEIPESMSALHYLEVLNLSFNNFMGKIPLGTQLQGFTNLSYTGNPDLCGPPLTKICSQDENSHTIKPMGEEDNDDDKSEVYSWFYMGLGIGFAVGFWGVIGPIFFNRRCRHAYFRFLHQCMTSFSKR